MKSRLSMCGALAASAALLLTVAAPANADSSDAYLKPALKDGEHLADVFSKAVSIQGAGFDEYVKRVSGSADYTVSGVAEDGITFSSDYRYDGFASGSGSYKALSDGMTNCNQGKCTLDDETSGLLFNPYLWGPVPKDIHVGSTWTVHIAKSWEIGPPGTEEVRVVSLDPANGAITLAREGNGSGTSSDDEARAQSGKPVTITKDGKQIEVSVIPGATHWSGYTTISKGVIVGDVIMVERHVTLVTKAGEKFEGEQRTYTLLNLLQDKV
jgi:hypothetical protein